MGIQYSIAANLYISATGIGATPVFVPVKTVKDVKLDIKHGEADLNSRANGGWKAAGATLKEADIGTEILLDPASAEYAMLETAFLRRQTIGVACMSQDFVTPASRGLWADCQVMDFSRGESLEDAMRVTISIKPTYSATPPAWAVVGECASAEETAEAGSNVYTVTATGKFTLVKGEGTTTFAGLLLADYTTGGTAMVVNILGDEQPVES